MYRPRVNFTLLLVLFSFLPKAAAEANGAQIVSLAVNLQALIRKEQSVSTSDHYEKTFKLVAPYYKMHLKNKLNARMLETLSQSDLNLLFDAYFDVEFYSHLISDDTSAEQAVLMIFKILKLRSWASDAQVKSVFRMLVRHQNWSEASKFSEQFKERLFEPLPKIRALDPIKLKTLQFYSPHPTAKEFSVETYSALNESKVILAAGCHNAVDAIRELAKHDDINSFMSKHGLVITSPDGLLDLKSVFELATKYPAFTPHPIANPEVWWAMNIHSDVLPTFYFCAQEKLSRNRMAAIM